MQLASTAAVVQSFRYGPCHLLCSSDAAGSGSSHLNDAVYGAPNQPFVLGGQIHSVTETGSAAVTFRYLDDWHIKGLQWCFVRAHWCTCVKSTPRRVSWREITCFLGPAMS